MFVNSSGVRPLAIELDAITERLRPTKVEEVRAFPGMTGHPLLQYVEKYSMVLPFTNLLRN